MEQSKDHTTVEDWQKDAACSVDSAHLFYSENRSNTVSSVVSEQAAKLLCSLCDVRAQCLQYAIEHDESFGIWGGLTEKERARLGRVALAREQVVPVEL